MRVVACIVGWMLFLPVVAQANSWDLLAWPRNAKLGVEVSWGLPYGWILGDGGEVDGIPILYPRWGTRLRSPKLGSNWRLGVVGWYGLIKDKESGSFALGPEVGIFLGNKYRVQFDELDHDDQVLGEHIVEERAVHIPVCLQATFFSEELNKMLELRVGYELSVIHALRYQWSPRELLRSYPEPEDPFTWEADRTAISGNLMVGGSVYLLRGCYLGVLFKAPIESLIRLHRPRETSSIHQDRLSAIHPRLFHGTWALHTSLVEFSVGIDMVALLFKDF